MKKLLLLSTLLIFACTDNESDDNPLPAYTVEGKWLWSPSENRIDANTMYEYLDGKIYTYYGDCTANNPCTDAFWNSLNSSDRIPGTDSYTYDGYTLIIDGIQEIVTFECDGGKIYLENGRQFWRLSSDCE
tara:strand:- start:321 stop:713 length:393 start_codon:yes stop_codon:yes gene_type:complete